MRQKRHNAMTRQAREAVCFAAACLLLIAQARGQQSGTAEPQAAQTEAAQSANESGAAKGQGTKEQGTKVQGIVIDRVVAVVNGDLVLESDVDAEKRFEAIQPYRRRPADLSRTRTIERLVDRTLIVQQAALEPETAVSDTELDTQLGRLRKDIPECRQLHCETEEGWVKFLADHGFSLQEFRDRWRERMILLKFIEVRFRNGITISDNEIKDYYEKTMLPEYAKRHVTPPPLDAVAKRIQEVLLQQQVSALLGDWLKSLRAQGSVRFMTPGEAGL